jgi:hypothetical protein
MKKLIIAIVLILSTAQLFAQEAGVEMADGMRSEGKIYVVVACFALILLGLLIYLFTLDTRLKKLEKKS